jgi:integrase
MAVKSAFRQEVENDPKLRTFLDSVGRGSAMTRVAYLTAFVHFQRFLNTRYQGDKPSSILAKLLAKEIDLYELLDGYISSLKGSPRSVRLNTEAVKSYLEYYDVEISSKKFKKRCRMPKLYRDDEEALTAPIIRKMLLTCNIRRLKAYVLVLLAGALRAREALSIRNRDIYWDMKPVQIKIRKEYNKTRTAHFCFLTDEAAHYLKEWIDWKYRPERRTPKQKLDDDYVFATRKIGYKTNGSPTQIYSNILVEFNKLQDMCGFTERKDGMYRRKYTLHSFRRYTKTILSDNIGQDYSEWYLAHAKSSYWVRDIEHKSSEYIRVMKFLTFLDYSVIESTGKGIQNQLSEKDLRIKNLEEQVKSLQELQEKSVERDNEIQALRNEFLHFKEDMRKKAWGDYLDVAKARSPFLSKKS